jgi:undecaprenyl-diphosphatase
VISTTALINLCYRVFSRAGDGWVWLVVASVLIWNSHGAALEAMFIALFIAVCVTLALKMIFRTPRPAGASDWSKRVPADRHAFPSGHATTSFSAAASVTILWHPAGLFLIPLAVVISVSRVRVGQHVWIDVVAGVPLGVACGAAAAYAFRS